MYLLIKRLVKNLLKNIVILTYVFKVIIHSLVLMAKINYNYFSYYS